MKTERCYRFIDDGKSEFNQWATHYEEARTKIFENYGHIIKGELHFKRIVVEWGERQVDDEM